MTRFSTIALVAFLSTAVAGVAVAGQGGPGRLVQALDLTEEQQGIVESFKEDMEGARAEVKEAREAFRTGMKEEMSSGNPNVKQLQRLIDAKVEAQRAVAYQAVEDMAALSVTLSDEQLEKLIELQEQREERRAEGGRGGGRGGQGHGEGRGPRGDF